LQAVYFVVFIFGGASGVRFRMGLLGSASCRKQYATIDKTAIIAAPHCPLLPSDFFRKPQSQHFWRSRKRKPRYHRGMAVVHMSDTEAARDLAGIMARVSAGDEVIIDNGTLTVAVVPSAIPSRRTDSECIALARKHEEEAREVPILDLDFAADVEEIIRNRKPWNPPAWD
jgi:antitoxin (DNA-binding transcriptional repressor) of toxin-antitoxin stability system